jgi:aldehyde dehydrogenase (NAD+)
MTEARAAVLETGLLLGDRWVAQSEGGVMEHVNATSGKVQKAFPIASVGEVDEAVQAARSAFDGWRRWMPDARREVLLRLADLLVANAKEFGAIASLETGSLYSEYNARYASDWFRYYAGWCDKLSGESIRPYPFTGIDFTVPEPIGVAGVIVTWNGPLGFCGMAGAPALAAGCCVVIKAPELAPFSTVTFGRLCLEAGIPPGVVNVITGGPEVGNALVTHPGVDKISFTGGTVTARKLQEACAATLKPLVMELGGKSANIVFDDADVTKAIGLAARFTGNSGQGCSLPTRLLVHRSLYSQVLDGVVALAEQVVVGDPFDPTTTMGPVISAGAADRILGMVGEATSSDSGILATGGGRKGGDLADGFFVEPTVLADVDPTSTIAQEEVFGPVLCVLPFDEEAEAVEIANGTRYGLAAYVQTTDMARAHRMIDALQAGNVHINGSGPGPVSPASPFGGVKQSGYGRQGGREGIAEFLRTKNVYINA